MAFRWDGLTEVQRFILDNLAGHPGDIAKIAGTHFRISRQAVNRQLRDLVEKGVLKGTGQTRSREYTPAVLGEHKVELTTAGLEEHLVWRDHVAPVLGGVPGNVLDICHYGVTEIVNNAIDHSGSPKVNVFVTYTAVLISIIVKDDGIGIFKKIKEACGLEDERHAVLELTKGKLTTDPEHHTGEGIFFTSRMFDQFGILSGTLYLGHVREASDWLLESREGETPGTSVKLDMNPRSQPTIQEVFDRYATDREDFAFSRTHVVVALARVGNENLVSRSQAKRVMMRLDRFKEIVLDFQGVDSIGPAFADEIFRVFKLEHPGIRITPIQMNEEVARMVRRAMSATDTLAVGTTPPTAG